MRLLAGRWRIHPSSPRQILRAAILAMLRLIIAEKNPVIKEPV